MFRDRLRSRPLGEINRLRERGIKRRAHQEKRTCGSVRPFVEKTSIDIIEGGFRGRHLPDCIAKNSALLQLACRLRDSAQRGLDCARVRPGYHHLFGNGNGGAHGNKTAERPQAVEGRAVFIAARPGRTGDLDGSQSLRDLPSARGVIHR